MRAVVLVAMLAACDDLGFEDSPPVDTIEGCEKAGGVVRMQAGAYVCDFPGAQNGAATIARASADDAGSHD